MLMEEPRLPSAHNKKNCTSHRPISAQSHHGRPLQTHNVGIYDSSTWLRRLKDRRGRPSSDASSPLVSVAQPWVSLALLRVATWNTVPPSTRVFSVDSPGFW